MKFSACYIAKNESKNLMRSIDSIKECIDELVVIDTGSEDDTVEIAKKAGAEVGFFEWIGDFSAARNYALSQTHGDLVFFLDADEWFEPALTKKDREEITALFENNPSIETLQVQINSLNDQGAIKDTGSGNRLLRMGRGLKYIKKIHELVARPNGSVPNNYTTLKWQLKHSGYVEDVMPMKMRRNVELLEDAAVSSEDPVERNLQRFYLVREYNTSGDIESSFKNYQILIKEPDLIKKQFAYLNHGFAPLLYRTFYVAADSRLRQRTSRREVYKKLVEPFLNYLKTYPGHATMELLYRAKYDHNEDYLLEKLNPALEHRKRLGISPVSAYKEGEMVLNQMAAVACYRRGQLTKAMDYAVESFKDTEYNNPMALHVLLMCMRGIPAADIIAFLNSQFDLKNAHRLNFLMAGSRLHGFNDVHMYYLDKLIKAQLATKFDYYYLLIMYGKCKEAVDAALQQKSEDIAHITAKAIFLAAVCADDESLFLSNKEHLSGYEAVLEAFFSGEKPDDPGDAGARIMSDTYERIALAAGLERADRLRGLFMDNQPLLCYQVRARYCTENGLFEETLAEEMPRPDDRPSYRYAAESLLALGRCGEAQELLERAFSRGAVDNELLQLALSVAARATGPVKSRARELFEQYTGPYNALVDLSDAVNTGYITENTDNKKQKFYRSMTRTQFQKQLKDEQGKPRILGSAETNEKAAELFRGKNMPATAMEHARAAFAAGHNPEENKARMAGFFRTIGNAQIAAEIEKL